MESPDDARCPITQVNASTSGLRNIVAASVSDATNKEGRSPDRPGGYKPPLPGNRGKVILWDDTFVRYHEPHIGMAAVKVLEALGFEVALVKNRRCCGRPAFSQGNLDAAAKLAKHNISQLSTPNSQLSTAPILFLEPSCWSMFVEDYRELKIENAENIAGRCFLFEKFVADLLAQEPEALRFKRARTANVLIHPHCHAKSILNPAFMATLAERLPGRKATVLDTACCGMAGAFGALAEKYDLSLQVAQRLLDQIDNQPHGDRSNRVRHKLPPSNYRSDSFILPHSLAAVALRRRHYSNSLPRTLLLVDVCRRLPRAENRKRRKHREHAVSCSRNS